MLKSGVTSVLGAMMIWTSAEAQSDSRQGYVFSIENDLFGGKGTSTDRWYTNGFQYAESFRRDRLPRLLAPVRDAGKILLGEGALPNGPTVAVSFGQNMYTPQIIKNPNPQVFDRPWAGFLYLGVGGFDYFGNDHRAVDMKVGVIGPASLAAETQRLVHKVRGADEPLGWHNQLRPRLGVQASYMYTRRWRGFANADWAGIHGNLRATVGNTKTLGAVGLTLVAGERDRVFGAPDEGDFLAVDFNNRTNYFRGALSGWTFYLQGQLAAVAHNYFITGTTFGEQSHIHLKHSVWMTTVGASWRISQVYRIEYALKRRSPEFTSPGPRPDDRHQRYGEIRFVADLDT